MHFSFIGFLSKYLKFAVFSNKLLFVIIMMIILAFYKAKFKCTDYKVFSFFSDNFE